MILEKLTLCNVLTYHGEQTVEFPDSRKDHTLTVLVGPNNSGKTSLIRALKFWFYGEDGLPRKSDLPLLISNRTKAATPVGKSATAYVEVTFLRSGAQGQESIRLRRVIEGKRVGEERWEARGAPLYFVRGGPRPVLDEDSGGRYQRMIESMVPRALFDAFYFKGEPLDGKLLGDVGSIRDALGQFLHEDQWKEAEEAAGAIRDAISRKLTKLTAANLDLNRKVKDEAQNKEKLDAQRAALREEQSSLAEAESEYREEAEKLAKLGDEAAAREAKTRHTQATQQLESAKSRLAQSDQEILREVNQSLGIPFLTAAVEPVRAILAEMERDNILPADISEGFIDRVLARSACICGKKHDDDSRTHWEAYRRKTLAADANEGLRKLLEWVKPRGSHSIEQRTGQITSDLKRLTKQRASAVKEVNEATAALAAARESLSNVPHEEISRIGKALVTLQSRISSHRSRLSTFEQAIHSTEFTAKRLKGEVDELSKKSGVDRKAVQQLTAARDRADRLHEVLTRCRERLSHYFHRVLQTSVAGFYDSKSTDGSRAHIDRHTLLPSIHVKGQRTQNLGGGQSQLLALAYVVSLARLRQDMHTQMENLGVRLGKIDDLSFLMDSPFGNMERHYKEAAVQLVPGSARQVIVLLWKEDWDFAREFLEEEADSLYAIRFLTTPADVKKIGKDYRNYDFPSGRQQLIQPLPDGDDQPRSELISLT